MHSYCSKLEMSVDNTSRGFYAIITLWNIFLIHILKCCTG